ncbi:MAG: hypothetical protein ACXWP5_07785 [Bdellovibrionota bacterium]
MILLLALQLLASPSAQAAPGVAYSQADFACSPDESWSYGPAVGDELRAKIGVVPHEKAAALEAFVQGFELLAKTNPELQALGEFRMYRSVLELKLVHFAYRGMTGIATGPALPATEGIRIAAIECLNQIRKSYPSMAMDPKLTAALGLTLPRIQKLTAAQRDAVWQALASIASRKLVEQRKQAVIAPELVLLAGSGAYEAFIRASEAVIQEQNAEAMKQSLAFFRFNPLPEALKQQQDGMHLNLARLNYQQAQFDPSIQEFGRVSQTSNLFSHTLSDRAWAYYLKRDLSGAAGSAYNLLVGDLKRTFAPDAPIILAIANFETCHFPEALEALAFYKKNYNQTYQWLYNWYYARQKSPEASANLYPYVVYYLKKHSGLPHNLASEWIRSPTFIAEQQEMNLFFDEAQTSDALGREIAAITKAPATRNQKLLSKFRELLARFSTTIPGLQRTLLSKINDEFVLRNYEMLGQLVESFENSQLVEVEIYNSAGESLIKKNSRENYKQLAANSMKKKSPDDVLPVLDWGRFPASEGEKAEIWDDELGFLKTDLTNICPRK